MAARIIPVDEFDLTVFGVTGDLSRRKLLPALYRRFAVGQMPADARIIGVARSQMSQEEFKNLVSTSLEKFVAEPFKDKDTIARFLDCLHYVCADALGDHGWGELTEVLDQKKNRVRAFYLSVAPSLFQPLAEKLSESGLATPDCRVVVEKPLGRDLATAMALNESLSSYFEEEQIYRIDHFLGKETVQNLMALRFANSLFEPIWNSHHIDHVQITVAESIGVAGRGEYYDNSGAIRDMVQNHLMQLLCLTAMEPPSRYEPDAVREEKLKVIKALEPVSRKAIETDVVRGQYRACSNGQDYLGDVGDKDSRTESFVALKAHVANWRWSGTPFYLRTGKRMRTRMSEIAIVFKQTPHSIFSEASGTQRGNVLSIRLQPDEGITLAMNIKEPGPGGMRLTEVPLDMTFAEQLGNHGDSMADAYERLIMDVVRGDQTLFMRGDEVEAAWRWIDPIINHWEELSRKPEAYDSGSSGPEEALMLLHRDGRKWREVSL
ncbi:MAG: glucose-6-phosphate dehydrogenase [Pseudomonadota bacterium]